MKVISVLFLLMFLLFFLVVSLIEIFGVDIRRFIFPILFFIFIPTMILSFKHVFGGQKKDVEK